MSKELVTIKVRPTSRKNLKLLSAYTGKSMVRVLDDILTTELERIQTDNKKNP